MQSNWNDLRKKKWAGLLGGLVLAACGAPDAPGHSAVEDPTSAAQASLTQTLYAEYDSSLKTARCVGLTWNCDSSHWLLGRGQALAEPNPPNTLGGTCLDGNLGAFPDDEFVRKVRVFTEDQTPLTQGQPASVEVTVNLPSVPQNNFLDLYITTSVTSPSWTMRIATLRVTGTGGQAVLTTSFMVPTGSKVQALRAALRRGGTASACTSGGYDDRDDLVFDAAPPYVSGAKALSVASGFNHSLALREDGTLWGWGDNYYSQVGPEAGYVTMSTLPFQGTLLSNVKSVHATFDSSLALRTDGTVWAWGGNTGGVLGNGTTTASATPVRVTGLTGVTALATGRAHVLALKSDGTVWGWGENSGGQLGDGTHTPRTLPVRAGSLTQVKAIATGNTHSVALKTDGQVWTWGDDIQGSLGNGASWVESAVPIRVQGISGVTSIAASQNFTLAIRGTRELWGWGTGPLGDGFGSSHPFPLPTYNWASGTFSVFAGPDHAVAVERTSGTAWSWGDFDMGSSCPGSTVNYGATPAVISGLTNVTGVSIGDRYAHALLADGTVWGWGDNYFQRGTDTGSTPVCNPLQVFLP